MAADGRLPVKEKKRVRIGKWIESAINYLMRIVQDFFGVMLLVTCELLTTLDCYFGTDKWSFKLLSRIKHI